MIIHQMIKTEEMCFESFIHRCRCASLSKDSTQPIDMLNDFIILLNSTQKNYDYRWVLFWKKRKV